jgi:hypothetical protein
MLPLITITMDQHAETLSKVSRGSLKEMFAGTFAVAVDLWRQGYLPLRFTAYAYKLGYHNTAGTARRKQRYGAPEPLVWTGDLRARTLREARGVVRGSVASLRGEVQVPQPWPTVREVLLAPLLPGEEASVERWWRDGIEELLAALLASGQLTQRRRIRAVWASPVAGGGSRRAAAAQTRGRFAQAQADAEDYVSDGAARRAEGRAQAAASLKRTHDRWRRSAGGAAPVSGGGLSRTYAGSARQRHAQSQARYRARYR